MPILHHELPLPPFYDPARVGQVYRVAYQTRAGEAVEWARQHNLTPAGQDRFKLGLILIDVQNTFCLPDFELFVSGRSGMGAVEDNRRLVEFIYRNLAAITRIVATLDTHQAVQVFHPVYLVNEAGEHPAPLTLVSAADVESGKWSFNPQTAASLGVTPQQGQADLLHYTRALRARGKYDLTIWPYHAMLGGIGHALVSAVEEAIFFHTLARNSQPELAIKGRLTATENYSAIGPEVLDDAEGRPVAEKTDRFFQFVSQMDAVVIAGQAKSHCVAWTVADLLDQIQQADPRLAHRVYLLEDCASPVVVPGVVDYTDEAEGAYARFGEAGMRRVLSTRPLETWPGLEVSR
jgi:nicotinamidase-related amidase